MLLSLSSVSAKKVGVYCFFDNSGSQLYEDDVVKLVIANVYGSMMVAIENKTDNIIYIDKANTFVYINGTPISLFQNSVTTTSESGSKGASFNFGATTIGGGSTTTNATTFYEQRVLAVAPHSAEKLFSTRICFNPNVLYEGDLGGFTPFRAGRDGRFIDPDGTQTKFRRGMSRHYDQTRTAFEIKVAATYSPDETFTERKLVKADYHISDVVIDHKKGVYKPHKVELPYCAPYFAKGLDCYRFKTGRDVGGCIGAYVTGAVMITGGVALVVYALIETANDK